MRGDGYLFWGRCVASRYAGTSADGLSFLDQRLPDGSGLCYFGYDWDAASRISSVVREDGINIYYSYDNADRLTEEKWYNSGGQSTYGFAWDHDGMGNRLSEAIEHEGETTYYSYNAANELTMEHHVPDDTHSYWYYDRGNCIRIEAPSGTTYFSYNDVNLMTSVKFRTGVMNYFHYDARGRRYAIHESTGTTYFTHDIDGLCTLVERDADGVVAAEYTRGYAPTPGIGDAAAGRLHASGTAYYQYPEYDPVGKMMRIVNDAGTVTGRFE